MVAVDVEEPAEESRRAPHLVLRIETFEIEHGGNAMQPRALARDLEAALGVILGLDHEMAEMLGQRDEIAFGVDDGLLHPGRALFQQPSQQMRFAGARIALHQEAGRQQFLEVHGRRGARRGLPHLDCNCHVRLRPRPSRTAAYQPDRDASSETGRIMPRCPRRSSGAIRQLKKSRQLEPRW